MRKVVTKTRMVEEIVTDVQYYCDWCEREIDKEPSIDLLNHEKSGGEVYDFCSWSCLLNKLPLIEMGEFIAFSEIYGEEARDEFMQAVIDKNSYITTMPPRPEDIKWAEQVIREIEEEE